MTPEERWRETERSAWERFYAAAIQGYMSDPHVEPADEGTLQKMIDNCEEIADASMIGWRRRWAPK